ncbi:conserved hypothetical protein [Altererythrobacter sp. B11]|uniref:hypothetical protein n=1 Tax=Altererythrobacter sp. B11 TaxID=2060312 RepID=UPI000DC6F3E8|nr:hypothetical protein [Altererythrobacter sp. B11]BBC72520.1 conserved hypothetical protein [Altererythrobacter sp. B11]
MNRISRGLIGTVAAGAVAITSASPAFARERRYDHDDGIDAGDVIAGALIIGGIAAVAAAASNNRDRRDYRDYRDGRGYRDSPRSAVEQCVYAAERTASRYSYGGRAKVTDIRDIDRRRDGYRVKGRIAVNTHGRDWRVGDNRYGRGWNNDYRGWNDRYRGYDAGSFTCRVEYGRVVDIDYSGIRGL